MNTHWCERICNYEAHNIHSVHISVVRQTGRYVLHQFKLVAMIKKKSSPNSDGLALLGHDNHCLCIKAIQVQERE